MFTEHRHLDGFNYYYRGFESQPDAILAIDDAYSLTKSYWKPIASSGSNLAEMVGSMQYSDCAHTGRDQTSFNRRDLTGFAIVAPDKNTAGYLYSCFDWFPVKFLDGNRISVFFPQENERGEPIPLATFD